ncbi:MAG: glutamate--tRNA ligase [Bacteroidota bacterium]
MDKPRVRFAPSPTGALHIGGVRTALYDYLIAKQQDGDFVLRIEDTDQTRYVPGAEDYIKAALEWVGLVPDEGPGYGGNYGPYRQSERKHLYKEYSEKLIASGHAYYAFDTPEELTAAREVAQAAGNHSFKYDATTRQKMRNSISLSKTEVDQLLADNTPCVIRLKVPTDQTINFQDKIKGSVSFSSNELDDKVMMKADGMPTYHLANVVDDRLMKINLVIRGDEWLSSTPHHVLLYRAFGWEDEMPVFAHLPLILKPTGKGKLSKRDGAKFGFPVFPLSWEGVTEEDSFEGFKDFGFDPAAVVNFLAFLGWNPGTEQEMFSMQELIAAFSLEKVGKSGARFDFDKAKWFNQQYLIAADNGILAKMVRPIIEAKGHNPSQVFLEQFCGLMKERVMLLTEFWEKGYYFFESVKEYEGKPIRKKWKPDRRTQFETLRESIKAIDNYDAATIETVVKAFVEESGFGFGGVLPILRIGVSGTMKGPSIYEIIALIGKEETDARLAAAYDAFDSMKS